MVRVSKWLAGVGLLSAVAVLGAGISARGAVTPQQQAQIKELDEQLKQVGQLALARKYEEAKTLLESIQGPIVALAANSDPDVKRQASPLLASLMARRRFLESRGVTLAKLPEAGSPSGGGTVSFTKDVAPILVSRCRNCHINNTRGMFSMASFERLMNGIGGAAVINPGSAQTSRLHEVLARGEMPPNGNVPQAEIEVIARWINEGAKFDGTDPRASIATGQAAPPPTATPPRPSIQQATGRETVLYSRDIAPVLVESCTGCHGGQQPRAQLGLDTFRRLVNGGDNGPILVQGNPADSLLIKKLKGTASGQRMPAGRAPLSAEIIAKFEKWIAEGAKFDGTDPNMQTEMVARIYAATQMSHEELAQERVAMADRNWRLTSPGVAPDRVETERHLLLGSVGEDRLQEMARLIDQMEGKVATVFKVPRNEPLIKGRLTWFVFKRRFEYSEFGLMAENRREIPRDTRGHWRYNVVDAYACLLPPESNEEASLEGLIAEQLAGAFTDSYALGKLPGWLTQGVAWVVVSRVEGKDPRVAAWNQAIVPALQAMSAPDDFLAGKLLPEQTAVLNYSFAKFLMSDGTRFKRLLTLVREGTAFDAAFQQVYNGDPKALAAVWARTAARTR
jgi:hypothetical protein